MRKLFFLLACLLVFSAIPAQPIQFESEEANKTFNKEHKSSRPTFIYEIEQNNILAWYESIRGIRQLPTSIFRLFDENMQELDQKVQELPDQLYVSIIHQFKDGNIIALLYQEKNDNRVVLYSAPIDLKNLTINLSKKQKIGSFVSDGHRRSRLAIRSGEMFKTIRNKESNFLALVSNETVKKKETAQVNYHVINSVGEVINNGIHKYNLTNRDLWSKSWTISPKGHVYNIYQDVEDRRAGGASFIVDITSGKNALIGKKVKSIINPSLRVSGDKLLLFATYSEDRRDQLRGRIQGTYLSIYNEDKHEIIQEKYTKFSNDVLNKLFNNKEQKVKKGNLSANFEVRFLKEAEKGKFNFVIEEKYERTINTRNYSYIIYVANSAICGLIDMSSGNFDWIEVLKKREQVRSFDAVGALPYLDSNQDLCLLVNVNKKKNLKKINDQLFQHSNPSSASVTKILFNKHGSRSEESLVRSKKEVGFYFRSKYSYQDLNSNRVYLILTRQSKELLAILK